MSTNWQGSERKSRAPISLTDPEPEETAEEPAMVIHAVPDAQAPAERRLHEFDEAIHDLLLAAAIVRRPPGQ